MSTPWSRMKEWMEYMNDGKPRSGRWTTSGKNPATQILAMDRTNDPFFSGQPSELEAAQWFAEFHRRKVGGRRLHLRALFYIATGEDPSPLTGEPEAVYLPSGERFQKTHENWLWFCEAAKIARNIGEVDPRHILDRKRSRVTINAHPREREAPDIEVEQPSLRLPDGITARHSWFREASASVERFASYARRDEPNIIEIWTEKDLDEADQPVLERVCARKGVNQVTGTGMFTLSSAYQLLERTEDYGLPVRILFLSDFDDAGVHMPISPTRHIEYAIRNLEPKPDIALYHLALKPEQILEQSIPRKIPTTPQDEKIGRLKKFEERYGVGTVELNTLTDPTRAGYFRSLLEEAIDALRDADLPEKEREAEEEAEELVASELERQMYWPHRALGLIGQAADEILRDYGEEYQAIARKRQELADLYADLGRKVRPRMEPLERRRDRVMETARLRLERVEGLELHMMEPVEPEGATDDWLFNSLRAYREQLAHYTHYKHGLDVEELLETMPEGDYTGGDED